VDEKGGLWRWNEPKAPRGWIGVASSDGGAHCRRSSLIGFDTSIILGRGPPLIASSRRRRVDIGDSLVPVVIKMQRNANERDRETHEGQTTICRRLHAVNRTFYFSRATHSLPILSTKVRCVLGWTAEGNAVVGLVAKRVQCIPYTISG